LACSGNNRKAVLSELHCQWIAELVGIEYDVSTNPERNINGCFLVIPTSSDIQNGIHKTIRYSQGTDSWSASNTMSVCFNPFEWEAQVT
jgi:hypothetical protein